MLMRFFLIASQVYKSWEQLSLDTPQWVTSLSKIAAVGHTEQNELCLDKFVLGSTFICSACFGFFGLMLKLYNAFISTLSGFCLTWSKPATYLHSCPASSTYFSSTKKCTHPSTPHHTTPHTCTHTHIATHIAHKEHK